MQARHELGRIGTVVAAICVMLLGSTGLATAQRPGATQTPPEILTRPPVVAVASPVIAVSAPVVRDLRRSTLQLEVSHPRATAILNQIMATLGNIGT